MKLPTVDNILKPVTGLNKVKRGMVWCKQCETSQKVDSGVCFRTGWPKCCAYTMTLDSPDERAASIQELVMEARRMKHLSDAEASHLQSMRTLARPLLEVHFR